jgi:surface carbohydrate biosynthesis protein (TIGR04326 family)
MDEDLLLWDRFDNNEIDYKNQYDYIYLWNSYNSDSKKIISIPRYIESNSDIIRNDYLTISKTIGNSIIKNESLISFLKIREDFSFWWMTLIHEDNYGKSLLIPDRIKLIGFSYLITERSPRSIELVSDNLYLQEAISKYCNEKKIAFRIDQKKKNSFIKLANNSTFLYRILAIKTLISYLIRNIYGLISSFKSINAEILVLDYLLNVDFKNGEFESGYWGPLSQKLRESNKKVGYVHFFIEHPNIKNIKLANNYLKTLNAKNPKESHYLFENLLSLKVILNILRDSFSLNLKIKKIISNIKIVKLNEFDFFPLYRSDLIGSIIGSQSVINLLYLNTIENLFRNTKDSIKVFYLQENQPWEMALNYFSKESRNDTFGVIHSSVRYWDLRYFFNSDYLNIEKYKNFPIPDKMLVNGKLSEKILAKSGIPKAKIVIVEGLRYLSLLGNKNHAIDFNTKEKKVLILTDYMKRATDSQMQILKESFFKLKGKYKLYLKCHPASPINPSDYTELELTILNQPIHKIIKDFNIVFTSNITTACIDAYIMNLKVLCYLDGTSLNLNPLRGNSDISFVSSSEQFLWALKQENQNHIKRQQEVLLLDDKLSNWNRFLKENVS